MIKQYLGIFQGSSAWRIKPKGRHDFIWTYYVDEVKYKYECRESCDEVKMACNYYGHDMCNEFKPL